MRTFFRRAFPWDSSAIDPLSAQNSPVRDGCQQAEGREANDRRCHGASAAGTRCWPLLLATAIMPWVWGVNAVACVLGSVLAVRLAVAWGLPAVHILGATFYLVAGGMAYGLLLQQQPSRARPT